MALIAVLVVAALIVTLASTFIASTGTTTTISRNIGNHTQAQRIAESAIRMTLAYIRAEDDWRSDKSEGTWVTDATMSGGTYTIVVNDGEDTNVDGTIANPSEGDGDLDDDDEDLFTITATAKFSGTFSSASVVVTPEGSSQVKKLLFIVADKLNVKSQDSDKKTQLESWDYEVQFISDGESQSAFDAAMAEVDVAYVSEDAWSPDIGTKLSYATIGVVSEANLLCDELGLVSSGTCITGSSVDIVDTSHYITSSLSSGVLAMFSGASNMHSTYGTYGSGAAILAEQPYSSNAALIALDAGAAMYGGGTATSRRVHLPWMCSTWDISTLTDDGKTIMKRSLEWAAQTPSITSPILHYDFDEQSGTAVGDKVGSVDLGFVTGNGALTWVNDVQAGTGLYFNQNAQTGTASCKTSSTSTADTFTSTLQATNAMTVQVFLKVQGYDSSGGRFVTYSRDTGSSTRNFSVMGGFSDASGIEDLIGRVKNSGGNAAEYRQNNVFNLDTFQVLAFTVDHGSNSNNIKLYVDGVLVHTSSASGGDFDDWSSEHFLLGNEATNNRPFHGTMFDVKIWDEALSSAQLAKNAIEMLPSADTDPQLIALYEFNEVAPDPQLIHHWDMNDASSPVVDNVAGANGTVNGASAGQTGVAGDAFLFDGNNDYIEVPHSSSMMLANGSIAFWFNSTQISSTRGLFSKDASGFTSGGHTYLYTDSSRVKVRFQSTTASHTMQSGTLSSNTWYHVVFTFGSDGMRLYLNGTQVDTDSYQGGMGTSSGGSGNTEPLVFGANTWGSATGSALPISNFFSGVMDEIRIYDDALSASQVSNLHSLQPAGAHGGSGTVVRDTSGFGTALDLTVTEPSDVSWISGGGIELTSSTILSSGVAATKLYDALTDTDEMTLEVRFAPANTTQDGPARIVSYSSGTNNRNFTLGQQDFQARQRLKTTTTSNNGTPDIASGNVLSANTNEHIIVTYDGSNVKMYRDGTLETTTARTGTFNWNNGYPLVMGNETSNDRPWRGKIFRVAIYDRALSTTQVGDVFDGNAPSTVGPGGWVYNAHWQDQP